VTKPAPLRALEGLLGLLLYLLAEALVLLREPRLVFGRLLLFGGLIPFFDNRLRSLGGLLDLS
jgi:hypothetical protein